MTLNPNWLLLAVFTLNIIAIVMCAVMSSTAKRLGERDYQRIWLLLAVGGVALLAYGLLRYLRVIP